MTSRPRGAMRPSPDRIHPRKWEGAGNAGCALHRRSRAQWRGSGCAHEHTGSAEAPGIPCVMALRLMPCSPRRRIRLVTVIGGCKRPLNPVGLKLSPPTWHQQRVSGPHGFAVRSNVVRPARLPDRSRGSTRPATAMRTDALASTTSHPAFVTTRDRPSCRNGTAGVRPLIWGRREAEFCPSCHSAATRRAIVRIALATSMASSFQTHRCAMLLKDEVSDPHGEERDFAPSRTMRPREKQR